MERNMRLYNYYLYGEENSYGQPTLSAEIAGQIKIAIFNTSTSVQDNINYKGASYVGLTQDLSVNDKYVIEHGTEKLKVLYISSYGRYKQVYMGAI